MSNTLRPLRGMKDLLPQEFSIHEYIITNAIKIANLYGYEQISTPLVEYLPVFDRTLGESSDIVSKEMYYFTDKSGNQVALRPEFTAGIMRAIITGGLQQQIPLRFFSTGPLFRYDRPQSGRQRQFHQVNFENVGLSHPAVDAETIKLAVDFLASLNVISDIQLEINSLGCTKSRQNYERNLKSYLTKYANDLSEDSVKRLEKNPLRILDSKDTKDQNIIKNAPVLSDYYEAESQEYFIQVLEYLDLLKVNYTINPRLVRGLDYYNHTAFEFTTNKFEGQATVLAGGRYDNLAKLMGGPNLPAIGFAAGIERLALLRDYNLQKPRALYVLPIETDNIRYAYLMADRLRQADLSIPIIVDSSGKIGKRVQRAVQQNAKYVVFIGIEEQAHETFKLKDLDSTQESTVDFDRLVQLLNS